MGRINMTRVILGGLVAGIVANIIDAVTGMVFMKQDMLDMLQRLNLDPPAMDSMSGILPWVLVDLAYGFLIVLAYAGLRPRFGPGPLTALYAGFLLYAAVTITLYGFMSMGIFTSDMFVKSAGFAVVSTALASLAGGAVYTE